MTKHTDTGTERVVLLQVLERPEACSRAELEVALDDVAPSAIGTALDALAVEGVLYVGREQVRASRCVRHVDRLGLIAV
jgi:hypothetical protein